MIEKIVVLFLVILFLEAMIASGNWPPHVR